MFVFVDSLQMFADDLYCPVHKMEVVFMHPKVNGYTGIGPSWRTEIPYWRNMCSSDRAPEPPKPRHGFKFAEEEKAKSFYKIMKNSLRN